MSNQVRNNNLNYLIDPTFTNVNRLFVLYFKNENYSFENENDLCLICIKMKTQKIVNSLSVSEKLNSKFATRKWYIINDENNGQYGRGNGNDSTIKFETKVIKPNLCYYSDGYILVTGDIKVTAVAADTNAALMMNTLKLLKIWI